ncbi:MAG: hypothetical protein A2Y38_02485 [Spirochaetes bacterium GWB1_59_5]|nr:MAG: hypothetical protein A2Y38_02485 [Spirochaetes bacterium GWB1_59_5]
MCPKTSRDIKSKMVKKGITQTRVAKDLHITQGAVSGVVNLHRKSKRIQKYIADLLGEAYDKLWGKAA